MEKLPLIEVSTICFSSSLTGAVISSFKEFNLGILKVLFLTSGLGCSSLFEIMGFETGSPLEGSVSIVEMRSFFTGDSSLKPGSLFFLAPHWR
jgi:hypothetical protein